MTEDPAVLGPDDFRRWSEDLRGPVALTLRQKLLPVEGEGGVIFPPTYAGIGYNIDVLGDGTKVAQIDSVGAQANRMEELFISDPDGRSGKEFASLVPQVWIVLRKKGGNLVDDRKVSLMSAGHRLGDALVRSSGIGKAAAEAFAAWQDRHDAEPIARLGPTSLVFGAWDSRGRGAKLPRLVSATIRAWDVDEITRSAQYFPPVKYSNFDIFDSDDVAAAEKDAQQSGGKKPLSKAGYVEVPATSEPGGIYVRGAVYRTVTVNLVALRSLSGGRANRPEALRKYILGLTLLAATDAQDGFLRQGCLLTADPASLANWEEVERDGTRRGISLNQAAVEPFAKQAAEDFGVAGEMCVDFNPSAAQEDVKEGSKKDPKKKKGDEASD